MNIDKLKELESKILKWGRDRKITINGNLNGQYVKLVEETSELLYGFANNNEKLVKDSVGDTFVVVCMINGLNNKTIDYDYVKNNIDSDTNIVSNLFQLAQYVARDKKEEISVMCNTIVAQLAEISKEEDFIDSLEECIELAYNEIKDRKGELNKDGVFIKEEDLK